MSQTSPGVTVRMLPNRIAKRSALKPRARLISTTARAKPPDRKTASAASPERPRARSRSIPTAPASNTASAPTTGEIPSTRPSATPARATWARVSAMRESRRGIRKTPMAGQMSAVTTPRREGPVHEAVLEELGHGLVRRG